MQDKTHQENKDHAPVLLEAVLHNLDPAQGERYLDLTGGYGGHAAAILDRTNNPEGAVLVDRDQLAVAKLRERFPKADVRRADFYSASQQLEQENRQFDLILADLGVSSPHLNEASRGFAFSTDGPLDMRMDQDQSLTAEQVVNTYSERELIELIRRYSEEPKADRIAKAIIKNRPLKTTSQLAKVILQAAPTRAKIHPATRTFQALRIAVNDELTQLEQALPIWIDRLLAEGGRVAVISFHSLEDRLVKQAFKEASFGFEARLELLTKRPVTATTEETVINPRARSAKLRAAAKIKIHPDKIIGAKKKG